MRLRYLLVGAMAFAVPAASMASVIFNIGTLINGSTPTGTAPYLTAVFQTTGANEVTLTMTNNMPTTNFVDNWCFNVDPYVALTATFVSGNTATVSQSLNGENGGNNMKAGDFDVDFAWPTANSDPDRFIGGETTVYKLTGTGLTETSFKALSVTGKDPGGWYTAAHVQGFGSSGSIGTKDVVPEPASLATLGLAAFAAVRRRKNK